MDHLFLETMVKEKETTFRREAETFRLLNSTKTRSLPLTARILNGLGDALIQLGRYLKTKYGMTPGCAKPI